MTNKEKYREFCKKEKNIPIFSKDWWLDSVCGEHNWDVALVEKGGQIMASMPYYTKNIKGKTYIVRPTLTQTLGPYIVYPPKQKYYKKLSWEKEIMDNLISQLPSFAQYDQQFFHEVTNCLPFYWKGFKCGVRYTYVIEDIKLEDLEKNFETDIRRRRRRKADNAGVKVYESDDIEKFYELNQKTFDRQNVEISYSFDFVKNLFDICKKHNAVKMYFAKINDEVIAANFLVYDDNTVYYLMGGIEPTKKDLGGMDVVQFESIKFALENKKRFDFEGSMMESIEKYFRSFGAVQKPYFHITKTNSKILKLKKVIKEILT